MPNAAVRVGVISLLFTTIFGFLWGGEEKDKLKPIKRKEN
jgi:hypothetical protein